MTKIYYEITSNGCEISCYITKRNEIMIEKCNNCGENYISASEIEDLASANGFNCCFDTRTKREFAESCHFNNILITKFEAVCGDDGEFMEGKEIDSVYLSELRKSNSKLRKFLEE